MKKSFLLVLFLSLFTIICFSQSNFQKGYVQITENDTIFGLINYKNDISNHNICFFKKSETDTIQKFIPEKIFGYKFIDNKYYVSKEIKTKDGLNNIFVEYLLKGTVNLFYYKDNYSDHYLLQKIDIPIMEILYDNNIIYIDDKPSLRKYLINIGLIRYYLQDCPVLFDEIDKIKSPSHYDLIRLIKKYHEIKCPNEVCVIYKKKMPKFRIDLQPVFGITKLNNEYAMDGYSNTDYDIQFGLLTYIWLPLTNERVYFRSGILYSKIKELDAVKYNLNFEPDSFIYRKSNYFKIPIQFQYVFLKYRISPTFGGGLNILSSNKNPFFIFPALNVGLNSPTIKKFS